MPLTLKPPRQGKTPFYSVRGTHHGVYVDRSTKTAVRAKARAFLKRIREEIESHSFARPGEPTFLDASVSYMAANGEDRYLEPIVNKLGAMLPRLIDQATIDNLAISLYPKGSAATRNRQVYTPISAVLKHAGVQDKIKRPIGWRGEPRTDWLWPEQAFRIFKAADEVEPEFGLFLRNLNYTGERLGEALALRIEDISLNDAMAIVRESKNGDPRGVFLPPVLVAALANHPRGLERAGEKLFKYVKCGRLYTLLGKVKKAAGADLSFVTFHTFRHTWATWMRRYGHLDTAGLLATQTWRDPASVRRYSHVVASEESMKASLLPVETAWKLKLGGVK